MTAEEKLNQAMEQLVAKAKENKVNRQLKVLSTEVGQQRALAKQDRELLTEMKLQLEEITGKPVFKGFTIDSNIELIVAIAGAIQYMKGELRELIPAGFTEAFDEESRTKILEAYGRLPYLAEPTIVEIDGEMVNIDPEAEQRAKAGIKTDIEALNANVNLVAIELGLLCEYEATQHQADRAWDRAVSKIVKDETMLRYSESLEA
jgi:hypothetical protein